jgi:hypothetical protein
MTDTIIEVLILLAGIALGAFLAQLAVNFWRNRPDSVNEEGLQESRAPYSKVVESEVNIVLEEGNVYRGYHLKFRKTHNVVTGLAVCGFNPTRHSPSEKPDVDDCLRIGNFVFALWSGREAPQTLFELCNSNRKILSPEFKLPISDKSYLMLKAVVNSYSGLIDNLIVASLETESSDEPNSAILALNSVRQQLLEKEYKFLVDNLRHGVYVGDEL